jgi:hypothetical protein
LICCPDYYWYFCRNIQINGAVQNGGNRQGDDFGEALKKLLGKPDMKECSLAEYRN